MDDDGDWITARYLLASILGRDPMVVDYVDEESFPVDPPPARLAEAPAPAPAVSAPPAVRAPAGVAGTVCAVCTEEIAAADAVVRLPCAHWYHAGCIAPWLRIRNNCPTCRAELPREGGAERPRPPAQHAAQLAEAAMETAGGRLRREASYTMLAGTLPC